MRGQIEIPLVLDQSGKDVVINDNGHHQELVLPKHKSNAESLAFDILTPNSIKNGNPPDVKKAPHDVFVDQETVSFDSGKNKNDTSGKDELWQHLYEIKTPEKNVPVENKVLNKIADVNKAQISQENKYANDDSHKLKDGTEDLGKKNSGKESEEDDDGIEDDYDDYEEDGIFKDQNDKKKEQAKEGKKIDVVPLRKKSGSKSQSFEELINEIYGGVLPYSVSIESINKKIGGKDSKQRGKNTKKSHKGVGTSNSNVKLSNTIGGGKDRGDKNVIKLSDHNQIPFHQDMLEAVEKLQKTKTAENIKPTTKPMKKEVMSSTKAPQLTTTTRKNKIVKVLKNEREQSKINASFKTPNVAETSPNPPTTKAVSVTAAPINGVKEYIQSKPLRKFIVY